MLLDIKAYCKTLDQEWKKFINNEEVNLSLIKPTIYESWKRCKRHGIDPYMTDYYIFLTDKELEFTLAKNKDLIDMAWPILEAAIDNFEAGNFRVDLFDKDVYLLKTKGSQQIIEESRRLRSFPGVSKREEHSGTNAIALAYLTKKPILVIGAEHYIDLFHKWSCASAPIEDSKGHILGFVNMTGPRDEIHPHTLGMVVGIVKAIEKNLALHEMAKELSVQNILLENVIETVEKGLVIFDEEGKINKISNSAKSLLGITNDKIIKTTMKNLLENWDNIKELFIDKHKSINQELFLHSGSKRKSLYMELKPLIMSDSSTKALATFQELTRVQNLAKRYGTTGGRFYFSDIIGADKGLAKVVDMAKKTAPTGAKILLQGESGTGKELFAHAIHNESTVKNGPFVTLNCAALPNELIESELFGYEEGAFTGAKK